MANVTIDMSECRAFFKRMEQAGNSDFKKELETFLEGLGEEFLRIVKDEFIHRHKNTGYGQLVSSFAKGGTDNIWRYEDDNLTLEIGTAVKYAGWVNDGHRQQKGRFIPGYWQGQRFIYDPSAKGGMVLKAEWVEGLHFWEAALHAMEELCPKMLEEKLNQWLNDYFA